MITIRSPDVYYSLRDICFLLPSRQWGTPGFQLSLWSIHLMFCGEGFGTIHPWVHFLLTWRSWIFWIRNIRKTNSWWYRQIFICTLDIADDVADLVWIPYGPESNWSTGVSLPTSVRPKVTTRRLLLWCGAFSGYIQAFSFSCALKSQVTGCLKLTFSFRCILHRVLPNLTDFVTRQMFSEFPSKISSSLFNHLSTLVVNPNRDSLRMARISFYLRRHLVHLCGMDEWLLS